MSSRLLMKSGTSQNIIFSRNSYKLRFHPSALTAALWVNPKERLKEEIFLSSLVEPGDIVIDVGANIGTLALTFAKKTKTQKSVFAFEPHPKIFRYMNDNIALNGVEGQVQCFCMALGDKQEKLYFSNQSDDTNNAISNRGQLEIDVCRLDDVFQKQHVRLLKIDVEGYEYQVLLGARETCSNADMIYLECIPSMLERNGGSEEKICDFLKGLGFKIYHVFDDELIENVIGSHVKKMLLARKSEIIERE